jgi:hypothetical protein
MVDWRPLSRREDGTYDEPVDGVPAHLVQPLRSWISTVIFSTLGRMPDSGLMERLQLGLRMPDPLDWSNRAPSAYADLISRIESANAVFTLDAIDFLVHQREGKAYAARLKSCLREGGSVWTVADLPGGRKQLERRAPAPVVEALDVVESVSATAHRHLRTAWGALMGRHPNPRQVYDEAVKAVEVVAAPIVTPNDRIATLGKVIAALRDKPGKWSFALSEGDACKVADMCEMLWKSQERHGREGARSATEDEAGAAFDLALVLVRFFALGRLRPAPG